jgi:hypothetical protein
MLATSKKTHGYRNGVELAPEHTFANAANSTGGMSGLVGNTPFTGTGSNVMLGIIDEVRIATTQRDASWIATAYAKESDPQQLP